MPVSILEVKSETSVVMSDFAEAQAHIPILIPAPVIP